MKNFLFLYILVSVLVLSGCANQPITTAAAQDKTPERHRELARSLARATTKADGELNFGGGFNDSSEIKPYLQRKHAKLYAQFDETTLSFRVEEGHVLGLVCDKDDGYAISEDSPCTPEADLTYSSKNAQCSFTLHNKDLCR